MFETNRDAKRFEKRAKALVKKAAAKGRALNGRELAEVKRNAGRAGKAFAYADLNQDCQQTESYNDWD